MSVTNGLAQAVWYHTPGTTLSRLPAGTIRHWAAATWHWFIAIIILWSKHENMSPCTGSRVITSYERIASCVEEKSTVPEYCGCWWAFYKIVFWNSKWLNTAQQSWFCVILGPWSLIVCGMRWHALSRYKSRQLLLYSSPHLMQYDDNTNSYHSLYK